MSSHGAEAPFARGHTYPIGHRYQYYDDGFCAHHCRQWPPPLTRLRSLAHHEATYHLQSTTHPLYRLIFDKCLLWRNCTLGAITCTRQSMLCATFASDIDNHIHNNHLPIVLRICGGGIAERTVNTLVMWVRSATQATASPLCPHIAHLRCAKVNINIAHLYAYANCTVARRSHRSMLPFNGIDFVSVSLSMERRGTT